MSRFEQTLENLNKKPAFAIKVTDGDYGTVLGNNLTGIALRNQYGSVESFFEGLSQRGIKRIEITERTRNGSVYKSISEPYTITISSTDEQKPVQMNLFETPKKEVAPLVTIPTPAPIPAYPVQPALNGMSGLMAVYQQMDHPRLQTENAKLTAENETLKNKNWELEKKLLVLDTQEGQSVAKTKANAEMMNGLAPLLAPFLEKMIVGNAPATAGLAGANLSSVKQQVLPIISNADDDLVLYLGIIANNAGNNDFINELFELMEKHNLIPKEDA